MLYGLERMQGELSEYADGVRGHVRIHANMSAIVEFLPEDLGAFAREHSQVKIDLQEHLSPDVLSAVAEGTADIGICTLGNNGATSTTQTTVQLSQGNVMLQHRAYREDRLVVVVPEKHALAEQDSVAFSEVLQWDIVSLHAGSSISLAMRAAAANAGHALHQRIQVTSLDAMCRMIDNGLGIGLIPDRAFDLMHGVGHLRAVQLTDDWAGRELRVVARDFEALPVTTRLLVDHLCSTTAPTPHSNA